MGRPASFLYHRLASPGASVMGKTEHLWPEYIRSLLTRSNVSE